MTIPKELSDDSLFTAARRVRNSIRVDEAQGGLLSLDTIKANEHLTKWLEAEEKRLRDAEKEKEGVK